MDFINEYQDLHDEVEETKKVIKSIIDKSPKDYKNDLENLLLTNGKYLRPIFFLISCKFGKINDEKKFKLAAAVELLHTATLIHDDVIDDAGKRRQFSTLNFLYGKRKAVLLGDYLLAEVFLLVTDYVSNNNVKLISKILSSLCRSEIMQSSMLFSETLTFRDYIRRISGKTAGLFILSLYLGGYESGVTDDISRILGEIGYNIGVAFQIIDDIIDFISEKKDKISGNDLKEGIYTLPIIYAFDKEKERLLKTTRKKPLNTAKIKKIIELVKKTGAIDRSKIVASKYTERALRLVEKLPENSYRTVLNDVIRKMLERTY